MTTTNKTEEPIMSELVGHVANIVQPSGYAYTVFGMGDFVAILCPENEVSWIDRGYAPKDVPLAYFCCADRVDQTCPRDWSRHKRADVARSLNMFLGLRYLKNVRGSK
jgi:hypothetical protein